MNRLLMMIILILATLAISGCMESQDMPEKSVEELKALTLSAAENLTSYSLQSTMSRVRTINAIGENATPENSTIIRENTETTAIVSLSDKQAHAMGSTTIQAEQPGLETNSTTTEADLYQMGNSTYIMDEAGNWTHLKDPRTVEEIWGENNNNQILAMAQTFNLSEAEMIGSDTVDGTDAYKLKIITGEATNDTLYMTALSVAANLVSYPMLIPDVNRTELNETGVMEKTIWISKSSYLPLKYQSLMSFKTTPSIIGRLDMNTSQIVMFNESMQMGAIEVSMETSDIYYDIDKPVTITPPSEALVAEIVWPVQVQSGDDLLME